MDNRTRAYQVLAPLIAKSKSAGYDMVVKSLAVSNDSLAEVSKGYL